MKKIIFILLGLGLIGAGFFAFSREGSTPSGEKAQAEVLSTAWIEVTSPKAYLVDGNTEKELKTGDEVISGKTVFTDAGGAATIHFPDGSVLRLDNDTKIVLSESYFSSETTDTKVKARLLLGRVWSKVISLASPASVWEVKTSSAVATVRGTAFSVEFRRGKASILGAEDKIVVKPVNPKTEEVFEEVSIEITENKVIEVSEERAAAIVEKKEEPEKTLLVVAARKDLLESEWVKTSREEDKGVDRIEEVMQEMKKEGFDDKDIRQEMKKELREHLRELRKERGIEDEEEAISDDKGVKTESIRVREKIKEILEEREVKILETEEEVPAERESETGVKTETTTESLETETRNPPAVTETSQTVTKTTVTPPPEAVRLVIEPGRPTGEVVEGGKVTFSAFAIDKAGVRRNVTTTARFIVLGPVGFMEKNVFVARLGEDVSELGEARGSVQASFLNLSSGVKIESNSVPVTVVGGVLDTNDIPL